MGAFERAKKNMKKWARFFHEKGEVLGPARAIPDSDTIQGGDNRLKKVSWPKSHHFFNPMLGLESSAL